MRIREDCELYNCLFDLRMARRNDEYQGTEEDFEVSEHVFFREQQIVHCALEHPHALATTGITTHHFDVRWLRFAWLAIDKARELIKPGESIQKADFVSFLLELNQTAFKDNAADQFWRTIMIETEATKPYVLQVLVPEILSKHDVRLWGDRFGQFCRMVDTTVDTIGLSQSFRVTARGVVGEPEPGRVGTGITDLAKEYDPTDKDNRSIVKIGIDQFDAVLGGGHGRGDLMVIGAGTSIGKSYMAQRIMRQQAKLKQRCLYMSIEDSEDLMRARFFADYEPTLTPTLVRMKEVDSEVVRRAIEKMEADGCDNLYFLDAKKWTVSQVCQAMRRHRYLFDIDLVIIDYLQAIQPDEESNNRVSDTALIVSQLKRCAHEIGVALIVFSQLTREGYKNGVEPGIQDCKWAGEIENETELMVVMWRDEQDVLHMKIVKCKWSRATSKRYIVHTHPNTGVIQLPLEDDFEQPPEPAQRKKYGNGRGGGRGGNGGQG